MVLPKTVLGAALVGAASGAVMPRAFSVPSTNGFPNPNDQQKMAIAEQAGGKLPNGAPPKTLGAGSTTAFQLIAFNELFETAFFSSLVNNITTGAYKAPDGSLAEFQAVVAQEQQHALGAISTLQAAGKFAPGPCKYMFPTTTFDDAVSLAETFTAVVLGALQGANVLFAMDGAFDPVQLVSSVIGQEGEQNGYYRSLLNRIPSESPFLTYVPAPFAFSALQMFVVKGSCPFPLQDIPIPILPPIMTNGGAVALIEPNDQELTFKADLSGEEKAKQYVGGNGDGLWLTYTTGQQLPFSVKPKDVKWDGCTVTFKADFPYKEYVMHGFSHGAITTTNQFANANAVADAALAGPAVIQVNNKL